MKAIRLFLIAMVSLCLLSGCTAVGSVLDSFDNPPELTSPCVGKEASPCGPKRLPDDQWLINHHNINISV